LVNVAALLNRRSRGGKRPPSLAHDRHLAIIIAAIGLSSGLAGGTTDSVDFTNEPESKRAEDLIAQETPARTSRSASRSRPWC
jgi:hypothetical protein